MALFNIESCEGTEELEILLKNQTIGSTMYNKRWVINLILRLEEEVKESDFYNDLFSLAEMSVDPEVSEFLLLSGSLDILFHQLSLSSDEQIRDISMIILVNCINSDFVLSHIMSMDQYFHVPFLVLLSSDSTSLLVNFFRYMKMLVNKMLSHYAALEDNDVNPYIARVNELAQVLTQEATYDRLCFILRSSANDQLLLRLGHFILSATELFCEANKEEIIMETYSSSQFLSVLHEALHQSLTTGRQATVFVYVELIGHYSSIENLRPVAQHLCQTLSRVIKLYINYKDDLTLSDLDMAGMVIKICSSCWVHVCHLGTFEALSKLSFKLKGSSNEHIALRQNILQTLTMFKKRFPNYSNKLKF